MDKIGKLFRRISKKDRQILKHLLFLLIHKHFYGLQITKLRGKAYFRVKKGVFRIIFTYDKDGDVVVKQIERRNESTYKNL
ncbi:MAG: hypothetical protein AAB525_03845 [Patescibacteria group bacterium]